MIIKSRSDRSSFHRRTSIDHPRATTLQSVLHRLLQQWDLIDEAAPEQASSPYALLVVVQGCSDQLVIDKQDEWALFCKGYADTDSAAGLVVEVQIVPRASILKPAKSPVIPTAEATQQKQQQTRPPPTAPAPTPPAPKFAFHSVEPQQLNARTKARNPFSDPKSKEASQISSPSTTATTSDSQPTMSLDDIMARSRRQGEGLNQLFGQLQARSAGTHVDRDVQPSADVTEQRHANEQVQETLPRIAGQEDTAPEPPSSQGQVQDAETSAVASNETPSSAPTKRPGRSAEEIGSVNSYLDTAWQERLAQMGHGSGGSPYAKLRAGKLKGRAEDEPVNETAADQRALSPTSNRVAESMEASASSSSATGASAVSMSTSKSGNGLVRSPLHALNEESSEELTEQYFPLVSPPPSHSTTPVLEQSSAFRFDEQQQPSPGGAPGFSAQEGVGRRFSLRGSLFKRNRVHSNDGVRGFNSQQNSGRATPDGAMTPHSFNSSVFRRRPLSVRSLSDALLGTARERAAANEGDDSRPDSANATPPSARQLRQGSATPVTASQRPTRRGHATIRSLSDLSFLPQSARRRSRTNSTQSHVSDVQQSTTVERDVIVPEQRGEGAATPPVLPSAALPAGREPGQRSVEMSRPTLLRASHSSPLSSTAVNLSSAGGITLHISSIVSVRSEADARESSKDAELDQVRPRMGVNLFDVMLPREIRLDCLRALVRLYEDEGREGNTHMSSGRRQGKLNGMRALVRLGRVSRSWQSLIHDGQLWTTLDASLARGISDASLLRICHAAGPFIRNINFANMQNLSSSTFLAATTPTIRRAQVIGQQAPPQSIPGGGRARAVSVMRMPMTMASVAAYNVALPSLTHLNVQGCRALSTKALHQALLRLPQLRHLNISNLSCVTNDTCLIVGASVPHLVSLNISRCPEVSGEGLTSLLEAAQGCVGAKDRAMTWSPSSSPETDSAIATEVQDVALDMQELRAVGLRQVDVCLMETMGRALRKLCMLDLSYATDMSDEVVAAFVRHPGPHRLDGASGNTAPPVQRQSSYPSRMSAHAWQSMASSPPPSPPSGPFVALTARQAGGNVLLDETHYRRIHTHLQHLSLSSCRGLTDRCCIYLAHALPRLEALEMANIGATLREDGLIKLLETTPLLQRLDVEGAVELGERFLQAITPPLAYLESLGMAEAASAALAPRSIGRLGRRALRRGRTEAASSTSDAEQHSARASEERSEHVQPIIVQPPAWTQPVPTGAHLTHLAVSHLWRLEANSLLALVRHCPKLRNLAVDDTHANDALLREFVTLARQRRVRGAYVSLVDCRALSKGANSEVFANGHARPRAGQLGDEFGCFHYEDGQASGTEAAINAGNRRAGATIASTAAVNSNEQAILNECEAELVVVKTFWAWQAVDVRVRKRRKDEAKRAAMLVKAASRANGGIGGDAGRRGRRGRDSLAMALNFISNGGIGNDDDDDDEDRDGRWTRFTSTLLGQGGDEEDDPRACTIM